MNVSLYKKISHKKPYPQYMQHTYNVVYLLRVRISCHNSKNKHFNPE